MQEVWNSNPHSSTCCCIVRTVVPSSVWCAGMGVAGPGMLLLVYGLADRVGVSGDERGRQVWAEVGPVQSAAQMELLLGGSACSALAGEESGG